MGLDDKTPTSERLLTDKQVEVLSLVARHHSNKEIARLLGISPSAVEQRLQAARLSLGAKNRAEAARRYEAILSACGDSTGGFFHLPFVDGDDLPSPSVDGDVPELSLSDVMPTFGAVPWSEPVVPSSILDRVDQNFGYGGRVALIIGMAAILAIILLLLVSLANALNTLV